jgi:hypothetical protein
MLDSRRITAQKTFAQSITIDSDRTEYRNIAESFSQSSASGQTKKLKNDEREIKFLREENLRAQQEIDHYKRYIADLMNSSSNPS